MRAASSPIDLNIAPRTAATPRKPAASTNAQVFAHLAVSPWTAMRPQGQLIHAPASAGRADDARAEARRTALSATRSLPARSGRQNVIPLVVPLARFSAWMARIQADASRRRRRMAAPFRDDPGPSTIAPPSGSARNSASYPGWGGLVRRELPPGPRRRVTHLASGRRSRHSPEIVDCFALSASGNRCGAMTNR